MTTPEMSLGEVTRALVRIEAKLDRANDDHEVRIRRLERWMWGALGLGLTSGALGVSSLFGG